MKVNLSDKTALICGASKGIGKAIAMQLAESGANVIITARNIKDLMAVNSQLGGNGKHNYIAADFQEPEKAVKIIISQLPSKGCIDILVNNSGGPPAGKIIKNEIEDFRLGIERHLFASHLLVKALSPAMEERRWGRILNIISISVKQPIDNLGVSNTVRGAMASWAKTLAGELGPSGITINNILPGQTATARLFYLIENMAKNSGKQTSEVEEQLISQIPVGRFAKPEEIAYLAAFLASDFAAFINGTSIPVDGGFLKSL
ncbi:MAG: SDR family oxidoreductase [Candidatus Kapabacteria bacterium]|nr:SDR family oxidoreductase [Ignavibacteriota bacterium]MCW5884597.1 SDR family oxidoreductase [Candidatus Kapabacteria bacterium]